jgi:hypothetical protein
MTAALMVSTTAHAQTSGNTWLLVVSGAGGEPQYREQFHRLGARLVDAAVKKHGIANERVVFLAEDSAKAPARGRSSKAGVERALADLAGRAGASDRVVIVLLGHGSATGGSARFNLPGPDVSAADFKVMLAPFGARTVAVVNTSSASGEWVQALGGANRVVITATKSGSEGNATVFPKHFVDAVAGDGADTDKDGALSLLEAYDYARREVVREYESDNRLLTEHAVLDDDGDGKGVAEPSSRGSGDGALARRVLLRGGAGGVGGSSAVAASGVRDPKLAPLYARRDSLQREVEALRSRKGQVAEAAYDKELERLLVALATVNRDIRQRDSAAGRAP